LLLTPLRGPDNQIYASSQGPLSTGGFNVGAASGSRVQKNHPTVGYITGGATVEREALVDYQQRTELELVLKQPDFSTANRTAQRINSAFAGQVAHPVDGATVRMQVPEGFRENIVELISRVENLTVEPDTPARVVINERTGTIVIGENVRISPVAVAHGNLTVQINEQPFASQPLPFSGGQTVVLPQSQIQVQEGKGSLAVLGGGVSIGQVVKGLNAIGATPRDLIVILQAIKAAGALQAELEIM
jgi:flagellar P-ring protein precursor FlgI